MAAFVSGLNTFSFCRTSHMSDTDAQAVFEQGVSGQALQDAITICALFNFMNRIVDGCGEDDRLHGLLKT